MEIRRVIHGSREYRGGVELRRRMLRIPLGLDFTPEELDQESCDVFLVGMKDEKIVATLVLTTLEDGAVKMRQVAVEELFQGLGLGTALVRDAERIAREAGFSRVVVSARLPAVEFYLGMGYTLSGETYTEVGIPHQRLEKALT